MIVTENKEMYNTVNRYAARITGKVTVANLTNALLNISEDKRPSKEYIKAFVKQYTY